jgi:hypothetical protein
MSDASRVQRCGSGANCMMMVSHASHRRAGSSIPGRVLLNLRMPVAVPSWSHIAVSLSKGRVEICRKVGPSTNPTASLLGRRIGARPFRGVGDSAGVVCVAGRARRRWSGFRLGTFVQPGPRSASREMSLAPSLGAGSLSQFKVPAQAQSPADLSASSSCPPTRSTSSAARSGTTPGVRARHSSPKN